MRTTQENLFAPESGCLVLGDQFIHFSIKQNSRIKNERLLISPEEGLVIEAPKLINSTKAQKLIQKKSDWILRSLKSVSKQRQNIAKIKKHGNSVLVFGKEKIIQAKPSQPKNYIYETNSEIIMGFTEKVICSEKINEKLIAWLQEKASSYISLRTEFLNKGTFDTCKITVKDQKTIWGSCSTDRKLNFSWRLIMAPRFASDYILFHELCHTKHLNHSKTYWKLVEKVCPEYKKAEKWFQSYGFVLHIDPDLS